MFINLKIFLKSFDTNFLRPKIKVLIIIDYKKFIDCKIVKFLCVIKVVFLLICIIYFYQVFIVLI